MPVAHRQRGLSEVRERAFLLGWAGDETDLADLDIEMDELSDLVRTAGAEIVGSDIQRRPRPDPSLFFGAGKVREVRDLQVDLRFDLVVANAQLSPRQQRNLERELAVKVLDRTEVILDIFAQHARTREGRLQVEVAQLRHQLPRLAGGRDLSRLGGGIGTRGPGEQKLEADRRRIRTRLRAMDRELEEVRTARALHRTGRERRALRTAAVIGYTNAGKSSILNALTAGGALAEDKLFATLDPTTRLLRMGAGRECLLTDTVGFIQALPHDLVAAFRATLEEVEAADVLIHVLDGSHPRAQHQLQTVHATLDEMGLEDRLMLLAINKVDQLSAADRARLVGAPRPPYVAVVATSAVTREGLPELRAALAAALGGAMEEVAVTIPYGATGLLGRWRRYGQIDQEEYTDTGIAVTGRVPPSMAPALRAAALGRPDPGERAG